MFRNPAISWAFRLDVCYWFCFRFLGNRREQEDELSEPKSSTTGLGLVSMDTLLAVNLLRSKGFEGW